MTPRYRGGVRTVALVAAAAGTAAVVVVGVSLPHPAGAQGTVHTVDVVDDAYQPPTIEITVGDTVRWRWVGAHPHSVTFVGGPDSHPGCTLTTQDQCSRPGDPPFERTFEEAGQFRYFCRIHGAQGMTGTVVVVAAPTESPTASPTTSPTATEPVPLPGPTPGPTEPTPTAPGGPTPTTSPTSAPTPPSTPTAAPTTSEPSGAPTTSGTTAAPAPIRRPPPGTPPASAEPTTAAPVLPSPSFSPFPSPAEPTVSPDVVAVPGPGGGSGGRPALLAVAGVLLATTAGAFGKLILFGPPWPPGSGPAPR